jgi:hypothetical protein
LNLWHVDPADYHALWKRFVGVCRTNDLSPEDQHRLWRDVSGSVEFHELPVPIPYFATSPFYVGEGVLLRKPIGRVLADFWALEGKATLLIFVAGLGSGKSWLASMSLAYTAYCLSTLKNPIRTLRKFPGVDLSYNSEIVLMNASAAGAEQSQKIVYAEAFDRVVTSPYFRFHFRPEPHRQTELLFPGRLRYSPGTSKPETALGWNLFGFVVDEAAFGKVTERADYVASQFSEFNKRRISRFGFLGWGALLSSPGSEDVFMESLAASDDDTYMVRRMATWVAKGELQPGAEVFLFDTHRDRMRVVQTEAVTWLGPGRVQAPDGTIIRYVPSPMEMGGDPRQIAPETISDSSTT